MRLFLAFLLFALTAQAAETGARLTLTGGTVINPVNGQIIEHAVVVISGSRIESVGLRRGVRVDPGAIDCTGKFIIPGLWDMHVHIAGVTANPKWSKATLLPLLVANGITGIRDMGGDLEALLSWRREIEAGKLIGPQIVAAGPMLADVKSETADILTVSNPEQARTAVREVKARGADFVKVLSQLSRESYFAIADEAKKQGLPFVGHVPDAITATEASNAGQKSIEHIFYSNLAFDCSSRETELRRERAEASTKKDRAALGRIRNLANESFDAKKADALWQTFRHNQTWVVPTLIATYDTAHQLDAAKKGGDPGLAYVPPSLRAGWAADKIAQDFPPETVQWLEQQSETDLKIARSMHAAGVSMLAGTDSLDPYNFPGFSLHDELKLLVQAGFTPMEALQAATSNPAHFLARDFGKIAESAPADLVILNANPLDDIANTQKTDSVILRGRRFDRAELDRMLAEARAAAAQD